MYTIARPFHREMIFSAKRFNRLRASTFACQLAYGTARAILFQRLMMALVVLTIRFLSSTLAFQVAYGTAMATLFQRTISFFATCRILLCSIEFDFQV